MKTSRVMSGSRCQPGVNHDARAIALADQLRLAFPSGRPLKMEDIYPFKVELLDAPAYTEEFLAARFFAGRLWTDISGADLRDGTLPVWHAAPWCVSVKAFWYFLPTFLLDMVCDVFDSPTLGISVVGRLSAEVNRGGSLEILTKNQREVVMAAIQYGAEINDYDRAEQSAVNTIRTAWSI